MQELSTLKGKKVLITGANGLLGAHTAHLLYRKGLNLRLMVRATADTRSLDGLPCEIFHGNITDPSDVAQAVSGCDYVIHTASITGQWGISYRQYEEVNVKGTRHVAAACLAHGVRKLIYVSTANTIGPGSLDQPGNELNAFALQGIHSGYINSKYVAQQYILEQVEQKNLPAVIVNPTFMIGPYDSKPSSGQLILYALNKRLLFYPPGGKNFVATADASAGILKALQLGQTGDCYLLAGENYSYRDFFQMLHRMEGRKSLLVPIPGLVLKIAGAIGSFIGKLSGTPVKLTYPSAKLLCLDNYYSGKKSERELQISYSSIQKATKEALCWFRENGYC